MFLRGSAHYSKHIDVILTGQIVQVQQQGTAMTREASLHEMYT